MKKTEQNILFGYFLLFVQPIFMSSNLIVARGGVEFVPPITLAFLRWSLAFLILLPFLWRVLSQNYNNILNEKYRLFFLGATACGICGAFPFIAGVTTTITNMGIIYSTSPIFIILFSTFFSEKLNKVQFIGLVLCLIGVVSIIIKGDINLLLKLKFTSGDLWMLGAALGWALYSVFLLNWRSKLNTLTRFTVIAFFGSISLLPFSFLEVVFFEKIIFSKELVLWVLFAAISPSIVAFLLHVKLQNYLGASISGFNLYLYTLYGAIYGIIFFGEKIEVYHYYGAALVLMGMYLVKLKSNNKNA